MRDWPPAAYQAKRRCEMALAEIGDVAWVEIRPNSHPRRRRDWLLFIRRPARSENPKELQRRRARSFMAFEVAMYPEPRPCWSCWHRVSGDYDRHFDCTDGYCSAGPDEPKLPPRELLSAPVAA